MTEPISATRLPHWFLARLDDPSAPMTLKRAASAIEQMSEEEYAFLRTIADQVAAPTGLDPDAVLLGLFFPILTDYRASKQ